MQYRTNPQNRFQVLPVGQADYERSQAISVRSRPVLCRAALRYKRTRAGIDKRWSAQGNETGRKALCTKLCTTDCAIVTKHALGGFSVKSKAH